MSVPVSVKADVKFIMPQKMENFDFIEQFGFAYCDIMYLLADH